MLQIRLNRLKVKRRRGHGGLARGINRVDLDLETGRVSLGLETGHVDLDLGIGHANHVPETDRERRNQDGGLVVGEVDLNNQNTINSYF